jgi:hypothetical protein
MAEYPISEKGKLVLVMESTDTGLIKLHMPTPSAYVTHETAEEVRILLARAIADVQGDERPPS